MKAAKVKGLDPTRTLGDNAALIILARLEELCGFMPRAGDPRQERALHDMRIAAKRLRYVLEVTGEMFGIESLRDLKALQRVLGDIHDCDVEIPVAEQLLEREIHAEARALAGGDEPAGSDRYAGLVAALVQLRARRAILFVEFLKLWQDWERRDVTKLLRRSVEAAARG